MTNAKTTIRESLIAAGFSSNEIRVANRSSRRQSEGPRTKYTVLPKLTLVTNESPDNDPTPGPKSASPWLPGNAATDVEFQKFLRSPYELQETQVAVDRFQVTGVLTGAGYIAELIDEQMAADDEIGSFGTAEFIPLRRAI